MAKPLMDKREGGQITFSVGRTDGFFDSFANEPQNSLVISLKT